MEQKIKPLHTKISIDFWNDNFQDELSIDNSFSFRGFEPKMKETDRIKIVKYHPKNTKINNIVELF